MRSLVGFLACALMLGCGPRIIDTDTGPPPDGDGGADDAGRTDAGPPGVDSGGVDAGPPPDAGPPVDAGPLPPTGSEPSPPANVVREGTGGVLLRGIVLAPSGPIDPGEVLIVGNTITCVAASCAGMPSADTVTLIETNGVISPGLVDAHNHLHYNFLGEWVANETYDSRDIWRDEPAYEDWIAPYADDPNLCLPTDCVDGQPPNPSVFCEGTKWGELRSIAHGTTTVMGQGFNRGCVNRLARNADHSHGLGDDQMRNTIASPRDINSSTAQGLANDFGSGDTTRYAVHMQEGIAGNILLEFDSFAGRDPRGLSTGRHEGLSLLAFDGNWTQTPGNGSTYSFDGSYSGVAVLIHCMSVDAAQISEIVATDSHVVWSPSSNLILYGETSPIEEFLAAGVQIGMGPDWTVSGEDDQLSEMRFGHAYGVSEDIAELTPRRIWEMATSGSAIAVGLDSGIGTLEVGKRGDVAVFGRRGLDPYRAVLDSRAQDVRLVYIDGLGYYGDAALENAAAVNGDCDAIDACGTMKFLCAANTPGDSDFADETVEDIRQNLTDHLATYSRTDLNPLIECN